MEVVHTFNPSNQTIEDYKCPRPGSTNAPSTFRLLEFTLDQERKVRIFQVPNWCPKLRYSRTAKTRKSNVNAVHLFKYALCITSLVELVRERGLTL